MHPNPIYRLSPDAQNLAFARERGFGVLAVNAANGPLLSHIPFLLASDGKSADLHLVRSNPIVRLGTVPAAIAVSGPDGYISPDWYGIADQVPTWNYVAVHLRGHLEQLPHETLRDMLDRQSAAYEEWLLPKRPWRTDKLSEETRKRLMRMILPFRLHIDSVDGTWKLSQNKPAEARSGAADAMVKPDIGQEVQSLSRLMRGVD